MNRLLLTGLVALAQVGLVGVAVAPQLSARVTGDTYVVRVAPIDPIDPFRGAYVALSYPDLRADPESQSESQSEDDPGLGSVDDDTRGPLYISLRQDGDVWVAADRSRERPESGPYLTCDARGWQIRCGIESFFVPQDEARALEEQMRDGAYAELRIDGRGNAVVVGVRQTP